MTSLLDLSHARRVIAGLVVADVSEDVLATVDRKYRMGRFSPIDNSLRVVRAPELLGADLNRVKSYTHDHFALDPNSPFIPCFYILIDERTVRDGSVVFAQQDWPHGDDDSLRTMPEHVYELFIGLLMGDDEWERYHEEDHDENDIYNPPRDFDVGARPSYAIVRFPVLFARLVQETENQRVYELDPEAALQLGLQLTSSKTITQSRRADGTYGNHLYYDIAMLYIVSESDDVRLWGPREYFTWGVDSEA
jgi:hypothetical protein